MISRVPWGQQSKPLLLYNGSFPSLQDSLSFSRRSLCIVRSQGAGPCARSGVRRRTLCIVRSQVQDPVHCRESGAGPCESSRVRRRTLCTAMSQSQDPKHRQASDKGRCATSRVIMRASLPQTYKVSKLCWLMWVNLRKCREICYVCVKHEQCVEHCSVASSNWRSISTSSFFNLHSYNPRVCSLTVHKGYFV